MIVTFNPIHVSNISYLTKHLYIHYDLLSQQHFCFMPFAFLCSLLSSTKYEYTFGLNQQILQLQN